MRLAALFSVTLVSGRHALADTSTGQDTSGDDLVAQSNALFEAGKRAEAAGDVATACASFEHSYAIVPRVGALLNLGLCREKEGRLMAARTALRAAQKALLSTNGRQDRIDIAAEHLRSVEAALSWITFEFPATTDAAQVDLSLDGGPVETPREAIPVESGAHRIEVKAPGVPPRTLEISVGPSAEHRTIHIDPIRPIESALTVPAVATTLVDAKSSAPPPRSRRVPNWVWMAGSAAVAIGLVTAFFVARSQPSYPASDVKGSYP